MQADFTDLGTPGTLFALLAACLLILAMLATTIRTLRMAALASGLAALGALAFQPQGSAAVALVVLFVLANLFRLGDLLLRAGNGLMLPEERHLLEGVMQLETVAMQRSLLDIIEWRDAPPGTVLIRQGDSEPPLIYIARGAGTIAHNARLVGVCGQGDFIGEMSLISGSSASATVTVSEDMRLAQFDRDALRQLSTTNPELARAIDRALNRGLAAKIMRMNQAVASQDD